MTTVVLLHRNLRLEDNRALHQAQALGLPVLVLFCLSHTQADLFKNPHFGANSFSFMLRTLQELRESLPSLEVLFLNSAVDHSKTWESLLKDVRPAHIVTAWDATPFARRRATALEAASRRLGAEFHEVRDIYLVDLPTWKTQAQGTYKLYTPFRNSLHSHCLAHLERPLGRIVLTSLAPPPNSYTWRRLRVDLDSLVREHPPSCPEPVVRGGRTEGQHLLHNLKYFCDYSATRNDPSQPTTRLGAHLKFGTVSIREAWWAVMDAFGEEHGLLDQYLWREFFAYLLYHRPDTYTSPWNPTYASLLWRKNSRQFLQWKEGRTGVPLVDAGIRELRTTGWMHNRVRMVVAQFLTKDLRLDWREGERFFAQHLLDYDPASNVGNWQWNAGIGADPPKYGAPRIFNPFLQAQRFDPRATYIRRWIPELRSVPTRDILHWDRDHSLHPGAYAPPMVDHAMARAQALAWFRETVQK